MVDIPLNWKLYLSPVTHPLTRLTVAPLSLTSLIRSSVPLPPPFTVAVCPGVTPGGAGLAWNVEVDGDVKVEMHEKWSASTPVRTTDPSVLVKPGPEEHSPLAGGWRLTAAWAVAPDRSRALTPRPPEKV